MIDLLFYFGNELILIRIDKNVVLFGNTQYGNRLASIDGIKLNKEGSIKEFLDLKDDSKWKEKTIQRFKEKINKFNSEKEIAKYIIDDLKKFGYVPKAMQVMGHRWVRL